MCLNIAHEMEYRVFGGYSIPSLRLISMMKRVIQWFRSSLEGSKCGGPIRASLWSSSLHLDHSFHNSKCPFVGPCSSDRLELILNYFELFFGHWHSETPSSSIRGWRPFLHHYIIGMDLIILRSGYLKWLKHMQQEFAFFLFEVSRKLWIW